MVKRIESEGGSTDQSRMDFLFKTALGRAVTDSEKQTLERLLLAERNDNQTDPGKREASAWLAVARVLLNTDEFITRE
jgi:hypothetical protein